MTTPTPDPTEPVGYTDGSASGSTTKQRSLRGITAGATVALALVVGIVAFAQLSGAAGDGADSPEAAVEALFAALANEDLDAAVDLLVANERPVLADPLYELLDELIRIGLFSDELDTSAVTGVDFSVTDLVLTVSQVDDDLANVHGSGALVVDIRPDDLPLGSAILSFLDRMGALDELSPETETVAIDITITTVRRDGRWYVSLFHSIGEHFRIETGAAPMEGGTIEPRGGADPDAAVSELLAAATALDVAALVAMTNPVEADALYLYAPILIDKLGLGLDDAPEIGLDDVDYTVDQQGDRAVVTLTAYTLTTTQDGFMGPEVQTYQWADSCYRMSSYYLDEGPPSGTDGPPDGYPMPPGMSYADGVLIICPDEVGTSYGSLAPFGLGQLGTAGQVVVLDRVDGRWYVSPGSTLTYGWLDALREVDSIAELLAPFITPFGPGVGYSEAEAVEMYPTETTIVAP